MKNSSSVRCLVAIATVALLALGAVVAADVPWTFSGDDTRSPASVATSAASASAFVSWTYELDDEASPARPFSSFSPGLVFIVR